MKRLSMAVAMMSLFIFLLAGQVVNASSKDASPLSGKVVETMNSGRYTYVLIEKKGQKTWVAVPQTKIEKGQNIAFQPGMEMVNFKSKTLDRIFEKIYFSGGVLK